MVTDVHINCFNAECVGNFYSKMNYECPLCPDTYSASLNELEQHLNLYHPQKANSSQIYINPEVIKLEFRIERLLQAQLKQWEERKSNFSPHANVPSISSPVATTSQNDRMVQREIYRSKRESDLLRQRCIHLEDQLKQNLRHYDDLVREQTRLKTDFESVHHDIRSLGILQTTARQELEKYIASLLRQAQQNKISAPPRLKNSSAVIDSGFSGTAVSSEPPDSVDCTTPSKCNVTDYPSGKRAKEPKKDVLENNSSGEKTWLLVFLYLDSYELLTCASVSKSWCKISRDPILWNKVVMRNKTVSSNVLQCMSKRCSATKSISISNLKAVCINGEENIEKGSLENGFEAILRSSKNATFLKITNSDPGLTDRCLWLLSKHCKQLLHLTFVSEAFPVTASVLLAMGSQCRNLESLIIPPTPLTSSETQQHLKFDDNALAMISRCWPKTLQVLSIGGPHVSAKGLIEIARYCRNLSNLEVHHAFPMDQDHAKTLCSYGFSSLKTLTFCHSLVLPAALKIFNKKCKQLHRLHVILSADNFPTSTKDYSDIVCQLHKMRQEDTDLQKTVEISQNRTLSDDVCQFGKTNTTMNTGNAY